LMAATEPGPHGQLDKIELQWDRRVALGVVMAAQGYPAAPRKGDVVKGLPKDTDDAVVFHAGTQAKELTTVTAGGRVLCVTVLGESVKAAQQRAYELADRIQFDGAQFRRDIGWRALKR
jgi:phosphoribosylamine---glycine ligase